MWSLCHSMLNNTQGLQFCLYKWCNQCGHMGPQAGKRTCVAMQDSTAAGLGWPRLPCKCVGEGGHCSMASKTHKSPHLSAQDWDRMAAQQIWRPAVRRQVSTTTVLGAPSLSATQLTDRGKVWKLVCMHSCCAAHAISHPCIATWRKRRHDHWRGMHC